MPKREAMYADDAGMSRQRVQGESPGPVGSSDTDRAGPSGGTQAERMTIPTRSSTHCCPIGIVSAVLGGLVVDEGWCLDTWAARVAAADTNGRLWLPEDWLLYQDRRIEIAYTAMDWVNPAAEVILIGISPGRYQARRAIGEAANALREGAGLEAALQRADREASFSGPMRRNLVGMLDGIGLAAAMGLDTTAEFFGSAHRRCGLLSATGFPVFVDGRNYTGANPVLTTSPVLSSLVRQILGGDLAMTPDALLIPLGVAAQSAVDFLTNEGIIDASRCLRGFPHPSGANGHRLRHYVQRADRLRSEIAEWSDAAKRRRTPPDIGSSTWTA
jgi:hypothetical protein